MIIILLILPNFRRKTGAYIYCMSRRNYYNSAYFKKNIKRKNKNKVCHIVYDIT